jgi:hypothetical protein
MVNKMKLGIDIGNSQVKGALLEDNNVLEAIINFPSAVTHVSDEKYLTYPHSDDFYIQVLKSELDHYDGIVAVGDKAVDLPGYQEFDVTSTSYKTNHPMTTSMLFGAIAKNVDKSEVSLKLAVSIPIVESKTLGLVNDYRTRLQGDHTIRVFRENKVFDMLIHVEDAVVSNEGQAGFLGLLDTVDKPFRDAINAVYSSLGEEDDPVYTLEDFLVCDIGEGTSDISVFRNKKFNPDYSFSVTQGIGNLLEDAIANARREKLTIESRKDLQHVLESANKRQAARREKWLEYVTPTENAFINTIVDTIVKAYGSRDYFDAIIFVGGGFSALTGYHVEKGRVVIRNPKLFEVLESRLNELNKNVSLTFGIPAPYSQTINQRGLMQILTNM